MSPTADHMTLHDYLAIVRRRSWVVLLSVAIASGMASVLSIAQTPVYEAEAQLLVQTRSSDSLFGSGLDLRSGDAGRAVQTEIQVLEGERVQARLMSTLDLVERPPSVSATVVGSTDVISAKVRGATPDVAASLANQYVQAYIDERREQSVEDLLAGTAQVQFKISELQTQIDALADDDPQRTTLLAQQATFGQTLNQLQVDAALKTGGASVVKSATVPRDPVVPTPLRTAVVAGIVGLLLGLAAAFAIDYFDDSVRTEEDLESVAGRPVLAVVPIDPPIDHRPVSLSAPSDFAVEIYRGLRTNIQFLGLDRPTRVIQVTSSLPGEGKTTTATNLAVVLAQTGRTVLIVDADLRRPRVHEVFSVPQSPGVIDLLVGEPVDLVAAGLDLEDGVELSVAASGTVPGNPGELLSSGRTRDLLRELADRYDYVIVDSAPVLPVADSLALAGSVDAVLFVTQAKRATKRSVAEALERLDRVQAPIVGMVLNQATAADRVGTYGYGYGYGDGESGPRKARAAASSEPAPAADNRPPS
ncbi:non-specific protein-tyrosine kinase [Ilumatobacter fluminis]|uniref:non-specific protein-tyrosine kinase n=1 Tax=Ilumatobacter fluminis TaxID=467091 RepID=A0A4R7I6Q7_9ACTN|nr:tyrosine-protein kinase domain-containing protein [Ilumatobacter fluminis]TDT18493.1 non-specific protein-tyrosine kinase [Ilumatobacter fluminis]